MPSKFMDILGSPFPFLIGLMGSDFDLRQYELDIVFNIDSASFIVQNAEIPNFPQQPSSATQLQLEKVLQEISNKDLAFEVTKMSYSRLVSFDSQISAIFFHFMIFLYRQINPSLKVFRTHPEPVYKFVHSIFREMSLSTPEDLKFYSALKQSTVFRNFIAVVESLVNSNLVFDSLARAIADYDEIDYEGHEDNLHILTQYFEKTVIIYYQS